MEFNIFPLINSAAACDNLHDNRKQKLQRRKGNDRRSIILMVVSVLVYVSQDCLHICRQREK